MSPEKPVFVRYRDYHPDGWSEENPHGKAIVVPWDGTCGSYRGYYEDLCLFVDYDEPDNNHTYPVSELIDVLEKCEFADGYKGGNFSMHDDVAVWVDKYSCCVGNAVVGAFEVGDFVLIETDYID